MKKLALAAAVFSLAATAQNNKPNFSGTWELDTSKSDFGPLPAPDKQTRVIEHKDPQIKINTTSKTARGENKQERSYTTDGREITNPGPGPAWKAKTVWVEKELVSEIQLENQGDTVTIKDRWQMSEDGKTFTAVRNLKSSLGEADQKLVYTKK